ncbi:hypothetical protein C8Q73DRAFT_730688 [Cubamyces lactineus]|nr:hypothetical protein C8Q73DRAFT_730688 [Cubamyces lactineus]
MTVAPYDPPYPPNAPRNDNPEDPRIDPRYLTRTPSPTPSEAEMLSGTKKKRKSILLSLFDPEKLKNPKELIQTIITLAIIVLVILFIVYQQKIVNWLRPFADWMRRTPGGWAIPIAILIVLSFPPLFGHEIVAILVGDVWGVGIGFGIVAAGTILGELANYFVFKWFCMARGRKWEEKKLSYALLAEVVRQGGFKIAVVIRYSAIPGHFTTAVFATCGMNVLIFLAAAILSLPKQLVTVYLGVAQSGGTEDSTQKKIKAAVIVVTIFITIFAMRYVKSQNEKVKEAVIYRRRKARQAKLRVAAGLDPEVGFNGADSPASPLLAYPPAPAPPTTETLTLDGVTLQVPRPQRAPSPAQPPAYGFAPTPASQQQPASNTWQPEVYALDPPQVGYDARARSPSRSPQPSPAPYARGHRDRFGGSIGGQFGSR